MGFLCEHFVIGLAGPLRLIRQSKKRNRDGQFCTEENERSKGWGAMKRYDSKWIRGEERYLSSLFRDMTLWWISKKFETLFTGRDEWMSSTKIKDYVHRYCFCRWIFLRRWICMYECLNWKKKNTNGHSIAFDASDCEYHIQNLNKNKSKLRNIILFANKTSVCLYTTFIE